MDRGVIKCDCGWTSQRKEQKRREEDGRKAAGLLNSNYVKRFSDRGVRSKASDHEREFRHYHKRALKIKTIRDANGVVMRFTGVVDRMNREQVFRDQMVARGYTLDHCREMDRLGRENPDSRSERKKPAR